MIRACSFQNEWGNKMNLGRLVQKRSEDGIIDNQLFAASDLFWT